VTTVTITWMDGLQETYDCYSTLVKDGVLYLQQRMHSGQPLRAFPVANVRTWTSS
jgi:hypothetical protein